MRAWSAAPSRRPNIATKDQDRRAQQPACRGEAFCRDPPGLNQSKDGSSIRALVFILVSSCHPALQAPLSSVPFSALETRPSAEPSPSQSYTSASCVAASSTASFRQAPPPALPQPSQTSQAPPPLPTAVFRCPTCQASFPTKSKQQQHQRKQHTLSTTIKFSDGRASQPLSSTAP